jgi:hypothetical protein
MSFLTGYMSGSLYIGNALSHICLGICQADIEPVRYDIMYHLPDKETVRYDISYKLLST